MVTGAERGLGAEIARSMGHGMRVTVIARTRVEVNSVAGEIAPRGESPSGGVKEPISKASGRSSKHASSLRRSMRWCRPTKPAAQLPPYASTVQRALPTSTSRSISIRSISPDKDLASWLPELDSNRDLAVPQQPGISVEIRMEHPAGDQNYPRMFDEVWERRRDDSELSQHGRGDKLWVEERRWP